MTFSSFFEGLGMAFRDSKFFQREWGDKVDSKGMDKVLLANIGSKMEKVVLAMDLAK
jgi:hypothetical protein